MANDISIKLDMKKLLALPAEVEENASAILLQHAHLIEGEAKKKAPVDTGFLRGSIQVSNKEALLKIINVEAEYGIYQEFGTVHQSGKPYLVPAVEAVRPKLTKAWDDLIK